MKRYSWEYCESVKGKARYVVKDARRGAPDHYIDDEAERAVALCRNADDAEMVVCALNSTDPLREFLADSGLQPERRHLLGGVSSSSRLLGD